MPLLLLASSTSGAERAAADAQKKTHVSGKLRKEQGIQYLRSSGKSSPTRSSSTSPRQHRSVSTSVDTGESSSSSSPHRFEERGLEEQEKMAAAIRKRRKEKGLSYLRRISIDEVAEARREEEQRKQRKEEEEKERRLHEENIVLRKKLEAEARKKREEEQEEEWRREEEERMRRRRKVEEAQEKREREKREKRERQEEEWKREEEERKRRKRKVVEDQEEREREEREERKERERKEREREERERVEREREEREREERGREERERNKREREEREKQETRRVQEREAAEEAAAEEAAARAAAAVAVKHVDVAAAAQQIRILTPKRVIHATTSVLRRSSPASFSSTTQSNSHLLHQCHVIASMLEDQHVAETIHRADIQGVLTHWGRSVPKFENLLASLEDDIVLSMHRDNGTMYVSVMADILYQRGEGREDFMKHLKATTLGYLRSGGDAGKEREERDGNGQQNDSERGTTATAIRNVRVGTLAAVAEMNGEACILSYEIDHKILVVRSVGNLGLIHSNDVARISLLIILSISFAGTKCHIVVSVAPYSYDLNFGSVQAVMSFVHQLQSCMMSDVDVPIDLPIGGGYADNVEQEETLAENYLNLVAAMHGF